MNLQTLLTLLTEMNSLIIETCYTDIKLTDDKAGCKNFSAACLFCFNKRIRGNVTSTTNFLNHIKVCMSIMALLIYYPNQIFKFHRVMMFQHYLAISIDIITETGINVLHFASKHPLLGYNPILVNHIIFSFFPSLFVLDRTLNCPHRFH